MMPLASMPKPRRIRRCSRRRRGRADAGDLLASGLRDSSPAVWPMMMSRESGAGRAPSPMDADLTCRGTGRRAASAGADASSRPSPARRRTPRRRGAAGCQAGPGSRAGGGDVDPPDELCRGSGRPRSSHHSGSSVDARRDVGRVRRTPVSSHAYRSFWACTALSRRAWSAAGRHRSRPPRGDQRDEPRPPGRHASVRRRPSRIIEVSVPDSGGDLAVADDDLAVGVGGDARLVGDQDDGRALLAGGGRPAGP